MVFGDVQNKHLSKTGIAQAINMLYQRLLRLEEELILLAKKQLWKSYAREGYAPECKTCSSID